MCFAGVALCAAFLIFTDSHCSLRLPASSSRFIIYYDCTCTRTYRGHGTVAAGPPRPSNFRYFPLLYYFCVDSVYFLPPPPKLYYCINGYPRIRGFPFDLVTWSAVGDSVDATLLSTFIHCDTPDGRTKRARYRYTV